jgi:C1A family cysteine protease
MFRPALGWHRELPDHRDWALLDRPEVAKLIQPTGEPVNLFGYPLMKRRESSVDLSEYCSPIENQGSLGSCTAQAAVGLVEYMEKRGRGVHVDASRLFLYKVTRNLLGWTGDTGAYVRTTMRALVKFGLCPEQNWPYQIDKFDIEPPAFCYAFAQNAKALSYYRIDDRGIDEEELLENVLALLRVDVPSMFGFTVYNYGNAMGEFEMPGRHDAPYGGHAVMAVGYDDDRIIGESKGAIKIRNSWGPGWGTGGYGWLPYDYLLSGLTADWWCIFRQEYLA